MHAAVAASFFFFLWKMVNQQAFPGSGIHLFLNARKNRCARRSKRRKSGSGERRQQRQLGHAPEGSKTKRVLVSHGLLGSRCQTGEENLLCLGWVLVQGQALRPGAGVQGAPLETCRPWWATKKWWCKSARHTATSSTDRYRRRSAKYRYQSTIN